MPVTLIVKSVTPAIIPVTLIVKSVTLAIIPVTLTVKSVTLAIMPVTLIVRSVTLAPNHVTRKYSRSWGYPYTSQQWAHSPCPFAAAFCYAYFFLNAFMEAMISCLRPSPITSRSMLSNSRSSRFWVSSVNLISLI